MESSSVVWKVAWKRLTRFEKPTTKHSSTICGGSNPRRNATALSSALSYWGSPQLSEQSSQCITAFAQSCLEGLATAKWQQSPYRAIRQNALRMLIATAPDMQVS